MLFADLAFPAHVAAYSGDLTHLRMLVDNGIVNVNERDDKGSTPLHKGEARSGSECFSTGICFFSVVRFGLFFLQLLGRAI